jgi:hypothetical protein
MKKPTMKKPIKTKIHSTAQSATAQSVAASNKWLLHFVLSRSVKEVPAIRFAVVSHALTLIPEKTLRQQFYEWSLDCEKAQRAVNLYTACLRVLADNVASKRTVKSQILGTCFENMEKGSLLDKLWYVSYAASSLAPHLSGETSKKEWQKCELMVRAVEDRFSALLQKLDSPLTAQAA